jgi:hypothetical protein
VLTESLCCHRSLLTGNCDEDLAMVEQGRRYRNLRCEAAQPAAGWTSANVSEKYFIGLSRYTSCWAMFASRNGC